MGIAVKILLMICICLSNIAIADITNKKKSLEAPQTKHIKKQANETFANLASGAKTNYNNKSYIFVPGAYPSYETAQKDNDSKITTLNGKKHKLLQKRGKISIVIPEENLTLSSKSQQTATKSNEIQDCNPCKIAYNPATGNLAFATGNFVIRLNNQNCAPVRKIAAKYNLQQKSCIKKLGISFLGFREQQDRVMEILNSIRSESYDIESIEIEFKEHFLSPK